MAGQLSRLVSSKGARVASCILCGSEAVHQFLDLGETALANKFLTQEELRAPEPKYPLQVGCCVHCGHVQLMERVPPKEMFEDYLYISSVSQTLESHLLSLSDVVTQRYPLGRDDLVIDVGCNDGTLLRGFLRHGVRVLGVDPAKNLAALPNSVPIDRYVGFFDAESAREILGTRGQASVITATNTFPHIPDLGDFMRGIDTVLKPGGVFVIEAHYLVDLLEQGAFDTIYHEHVSYWALSPMVRLFDACGMEVVDVERLPIHHGQLRVFVQRKGEGRVAPRVTELLETERAQGIGRIETYRRFADRVQGIASGVRGLVADLRADGVRVAGYGAPAKGNTLLGFLSMGPDMIDYIADRSPLKQGLYTPGLHIPVVAPERLLEDQPEYVLLLAWNFAPEILEQQAEYRRRGGKFIIPLPEVEIV